uniref:IQ motif containing GTPase activating protein 2 n=1 Tax=Callorhinchus milii TaxID=7868 RepID=A0A4W3GFE5_CALMI
MCKALYKPSESPSMVFEDSINGVRFSLTAIVDDERLSAEEMDERRHQNIAYEYLCHLEEAKQWIEACLNEELPPTTELEEALRNGVYLVKLASFFAPKLVSQKKIYDLAQTRYQRSGLHFRHTDNTVKWLRAMESVGLPKIFYPETTDVYDRKNMPRVIYCIHALSLYLFKLGIAPQIQDLLGKVDFTEEEISNMRKELEKYGIQMPAFSKIGGILANELSVDEATLHAAVIAINEAISQGVANETLRTLRNQNAILTNIEGDLAQNYQDTLFQAKKTKQESSDSAAMEERDMYEELLTRSEIQDNVDKVNSELILALDKKDEVTLLLSLRVPALGLVGVQQENSPWYLAHLRTYKEQKLQEEGFTRMLNKGELHTEVRLCNELAKAQRLKLEAVEKINAAIHSGDATHTVNMLLQPEAQLPLVHPSMAELYQTELGNLQKQNPEGHLTHEELLVAVEMLSAVAALNKALELRDDHGVMQHLTSSAIGLSNRDEVNTQRYVDFLKSLKVQAVEEGQTYLGWNDLQSSIDEVNLQIQEENEKIIAVGCINDAVDEGDPNKTLEALLMPTAKLEATNPSLARHYQDVLHHIKQEKCKVTQDELAMLWLNEIQDAIHSANKDSEETGHLAVAIKEINLTIEKEEPQLTLTSLQAPNSSVKGVLPDCAENYQKELFETKKQKAGDGPNGSVWVTHKIKGNYDFYYNLETSEGTWEKPEEFVQNNSHLTRDEIQDIVARITTEYHRKKLWLANEDQIIRLQACARGYLVRKAYRERLSYLNEQKPSVIRLQVWVGRGVMMGQETPTIIHHRIAPSVSRFLDYVVTDLPCACFLSAVSSDSPPLNVVRKFVQLLDHSDLDFQEELEVTRLREEVVTKIRSNQQLEKDLNLMDIKIGLLVKNRITLEDVISHSKKLNKKNKGQGQDVISGNKQGLKSLSKEKRKKLEAYQHLFYLLQTNPTYLAKLIFQMPQNKSTKFMDTVIFTLYNYASNQREEYLLLKLFKTALEEEITSKVNQVQDIVTGNPTVIKMVVTFNRSARGQNALRQLLAPVVKEIIEDKNLSINTNPIEVYKNWVNQMEMQTGEASKLPYDVTTEQALSHAEVNTRLESSVRSLRAATDKVLASIFTSLDNIPYGMRYIAKVLKNSLHEKFPDSTEDELLKIVGNLLYYRYMNPAIVAPDGFDIIDVSAGGQLHSDQRRNLGSVAKVLQHAASNKLFEGENAHMSPINDYLSHTYQKFRKFFQSACDVPEPEEKFNIDEYSDMVTLSKPVIYISIEEIINTHSLLLEHQQAISPDQKDPLHELLKDLGDVPDVETLIGEGAVVSNDPNKENVLSQLAKTEVSLTLMSKFELREGDDRNMKSLMIKTKRLIEDVIRTQSGETLSEILETPASSQQEAEHMKVVKNRAILDAKIPDEMKHNQSILEDGLLPIEQKKRKIQRNLRTLEQAGLASSANKFQEIISDIAKDIRNQRRYRQHRKAELVKVQQTVNALNSKSQFYEEQNNYYNTYIKTCLDNLTRKNVRRSIKLDGKGEEKGSKKSKPTTLRYTASRLHEKGVVMEIDGLQSNQFKNVLFDITPGEEVGDFEVKAKFMGIEMEKIQLHFQDLLQLQYDGVAVMKIFDKAKINVNLLVFLLNKKFYGK